MKLATKLLGLVPFALAGIGACSDDSVESEPVDSSQSAVASVLTFDNPTPSGSPDTALGTFGGIVWGNGWFWSGPYASNSTNHAYFSTNVTSRSFSFASGPRRLTSVRVYALESGTLTLGDSGGQTRSLAIGVGAPVTLATNWTQASTTVTVSFSGGWAFGLDDIATDDATGSDAGTGGVGGSDAGNDTGSNDSGTAGGGGTLAVATFDSPAPPGGADSLVGVFSGIDFGNQWRWSGPYAADPSNHVYFASDASSRSFTFVGGVRVLESVRAYALTAGTLTLADSNGQTRSQALVPGSLSTIMTGWIQASTTVTVSFSGGWAFGLDDIASRGSGAADAGTGGGGNDAGAGAGGSRSLAFHTNSGPDDYARLVDLPPTFGTGAFTLELWIRPDASADWTNADPNPNSGDPNWWFVGDFLLDGHDNDGDHAGTFDLQLYAGGRLRWLFHDGSQLLGVQADSTNTAPPLLGNWHHVAAVRRFVGSGSRLELWVDGVQIAYRTTTTQPNMRTWWNTWSTFPANERGWFFGAEKQSATGGAYWYDYKGRVAEVRFFDAAKSATSLASDWQKAVTAATPNLVGWFRLQEGSGTVSCDALSSTRCMSLVPRTQPIWSADAPPLN